MNSIKKLQSLLLFYVSITLLLLADKTLSFGGISSSSGSWSSVGSSVRSLKILGHHDTGGIISSSSSSSSRITYSSRCVCFFCATTLSSSSSLSRIVLGRNKKESLRFIVQSKNFNNDDDNVVAAAASESVDNTNTGDIDNTEQRRTTTTTTTTTTVVMAVKCPNCELCDGSGRIMGGIGAVLPWIPIKAYRPCPNFIASGGTYERSGQGLDEIAFGRDSTFERNK